MKWRHLVQTRFCLLIFAQYFLFLIVQLIGKHPLTSMYISKKARNVHTRSHHRSCFFSGYVGLPSFFCDCHLGHQLANFWLALKLGFVSANAFASKLGFCCWVKFEWRMLSGGQAFLLRKLKPLCSLCVCVHRYFNPVVHTNRNFYSKPFKPILICLLLCFFHN